MRQTPEKLKKLYELLQSKIHLRSIVMTLAVLVVFVTTYVLILPAFTLDRDEAAEQGGIDIVAVEQAAETQAEEPVVEEPTEQATEEAKAKTKSEKGDVELLTTKKTLTAETEKSDDFTVSAEVDKANKVPADVSLEAKELTKDTEGFDYDKYYKETLDALQKDDDSVKDIKMIKFYDISLESDTQYDSVEPKDTVNVKIAFDKGIKVSDADNVRIVHFGEKKTEVLDTNVKVNSKDQLTEASFETDGFSEYAVVEVETIEKTVIAADGKTYKVTVKYGKDAQIPNGAELDVTELAGSEYDEYLAKTLYKLDKDVDDLRFVKFFDITIRDGNDEVKIAAPVDVEIQLLNNNLTSNTQVIHFEDANTAEIVDSKAAGNSVKFEASGFSIYAVTDETKRLKYNFYNGTNLITTEYVASEADMYDPGLKAEYGQMFVGWAYEPGATIGKTIAEIKSDLPSKLADADDLDEVNVYAVFNEAWYLRFMTQDEGGSTTVLKTTIMPKDQADKTVVIDYAPTLEEGQVFEGWIDVASGETYEVNDTLTLDHHVDLYLKIQGRHWLVFDSNAGGPGSGATYTPPQLLIGDSAVTEEPTDPARKGYEFLGWYENPEGTGSPFTFGGSLTKDTTLYAKWEGVDTDYYVIFWKQKASDKPGLSDGEKTYEYAESVKRTAKTGEHVDLTNADTTKGGTTNSTYGYYFTYNAANSDTDGAVVNADGTTQLNVYYDRRTITMNFTSNNGSFNVVTYTGVVNGQTVELTPDGNGGYTYQKAGETVNTYGWRYTDRYYNTITLPSRYIDDIFYISRGTDGDPNTGTASSYTQYSLPPDTDTTQYYCYDTYDNRFYSIEKYVTGSTTEYTTEPYTGEVTQTTSQTNSYSISGLFGAPLNTWPEPGDGYAWQSQGGSQYLGRVTTFEIPSVVNTSGTMTTWNLFRSTNNGQSTVYFIGMDINGNYPSNPSTNYISKSNIGTNTQLNLAPNKMEGYLGDYWVRGNNIGYFNGQNTTTRGSGDIYIYYYRIQHKINFISEGPNVTDRSEHIEEGIYYEKNISGYGQKTDGSWYYEPDNGKDGYFFAGWYADSACQVPFDFNINMPNSDVTVYAKWDTYRVRTVLIPTPNNEHNDEVQLANNQSLTFRLNYKEKVSDANINSGVAKRLGYKLMGWYTDPNYSEESLWNFETPITREVPAVNMDYQTSDDWNNNTYLDNPDGNGKVRDEVKGILKLYAKWVLDVDLNKVYIEYDVDDTYRVYDALGNLQTVIPIDSTAYEKDVDGSVHAHVAPAPSNYQDGFEFTNWVLLNADGSESNITKLAGEAFVADSSYIEERTLTDEFGNTATIKVIRFKAAFQIDQNKATTVTFNGNGGVSNDSAETETKTIPLKVNENFDILGEQSFIRDGYNLVGWAFDQLMTPEEYRQAIENNTSGDTVNYDALAHLGIFTFDQHVSADNLFLTDDNNWDPLKNTLYAIWEPSIRTVTVRKVVEEAVDTTTEFTFTVSGKNIEEVVAHEGYSFKTGSKSFDIKHNGEFKFDIPYGSTFTLTEGEIEGFDIKSVDASQVTDGNGEAISPIIDLAGENGKAYLVNGDIEIVYTNQKKFDITFIKTDETGETAITGAVFTLAVDNGDDPDSDAITLDINTTSGVTESLKAGNYKLTETNAPNGYIIMDNKIMFTVDPDGTIRVTSTPTMDDGAAIAIATGSIITIKNVPGKPLPHTGGIGTTIFYILGSMLVIGCGVVLVARRRMGIHK